VAFIGICGDDVFGRFMLAAMQARGVNTSAVIVDPARQTGLSVILNRGIDRAILTHLGAIAALRAEQINDDLLRQARHLHVASYFLQTALQPGLPDLFRRAHTLGLTNSLDTNWDPSNEWRGFEELLPLVDVFLPNEAEACGVARAPKLEQALGVLDKRVALTVVKRGAQGAAARWGDSTRQGSQTLTVESIPVTVVDTVGAGDSFDAGFLYGYLNGWELKKALHLAAICGALSTQSAGGATAQPTLAEAMTHVHPG
jgi:sugar/nucleoside kinase (ribokinase family)